MELSDYGLYSLSLAYSGVINLIVFQLVRQAVVRFGIVDKVSLSQLYSITINLFSVMLVITLLFYLANSNIFYYLIAGISLGLFEISQEINRAKEEHKKLIKNAFFRTLLFFIIVMVLASFNMLTVKATILAFSLPYLCISFKQLYTCRSMYVKKVDFTFCRQFIFYTLPITLSSGMTYIVDYFDRYYINILLRAEDLGIYSAIYTLSQQSVGVILMSLNVAFYPFIIKAFETEKSKYVQYRSSYFAIIFLFVFSIFFYSSLFSDEIIKLVLGAEFESGAKAFTIIIFAICLGCLKSYFFDLHYLLEKKTSFLFYNAIFSAAVNIALNLLLIPLYGINGAAIATCITFFIAIIISFSFSKKERLNIKPLYISLGTAIASVIVVYLYIYFNKSVKLVPLVFDYIASAVIIFIITLLGFKTLTQRMKE